MITAKTITTPRTGLMGHPLPDKVLHVVLEDDGVTVVGNYKSIEKAQSVAENLNAYFANPPVFGDREAQLIEIINP